MNEARRILAIALVLLGILLLLLGPLIYNRWQSDRTLEQNSYHGFEFQQAGELRATHVLVAGQTYVIPFYYHPRDVEQIPLEEGIIDRLIFPEHRPSLIWLTFDPGAGSRPVIAGVEISRLTGHRYNLLNVETRSALQVQVNDSATPVVTCGHASNTTMVLHFAQGKNNVIYEDAANPNCIRFEYISPEDSIRVADRFAYSLLQII